MMNKEQENNKEQRNKEKNNKQIWIITILAKILKRKKHQ